jgi:heme oxygenase
MPTSKSQSSVRNRLREATHDAHHALHVHPLLARLQSPDLTFAELRASATVSFEVIEVVEAERNRRGIWPELSLSDHLADLRMDLKLQYKPSPFAGPITFNGEADLIGALYVIHGSALGGTMLAKATKAVFPNAPKSFFLPKNSRAWQYICVLLESLPVSELSECENGAAKIFEHYRQLADFHLQSLPEKGRRCFTSPI